MSEPITSISPPRPPLVAADQSGFAYKTARDRWPVILTKTVDDVYRANNLESSSLNYELRQKEAKQIISELGAIKYQLQRDKLLILIEDDGKPDIAEWTKVFNAYFTDKTWFSAPWLFTECYLYRRIHSLFARTTSWHTYDPYFAEKEATFKASNVAIFELARRIDQLVIKGTSLDNDEEAKRIVFHELAQICLWGNATDLSLLTNLNHDDIRNLQNTGAAKLRESEKNILVNDLDRVWEKVKMLNGARIDFVLDNAGFELYVDLVLADWLIQEGYASKINFHAKAIPWFVSDTTPVDFDWLLNALDNGFFANTTQQNEDKSNLNKLAQRWRGYISNCQWILQADWFWTLPYAYWHLPEKAPELFADMCKTSLVLFKGDLNYRKLVYDCHWPFTTPFTEAIGPLATVKGVPAVVTLRTNKADVIVGLPEGVEERLSATEPDWLVSGKYAVVQFSPGNQ